MITSAQIRAARALLRWTAQDLADAAGVSLPTVQRMEAIRGAPMGRVQTLAAVTGALEKGGVEFISRNGGGPGVRLRDPESAG